MIVLWFLRMFLLLVVFIIILGFALLNNEKTVEIAFFFPKEAHTYQVHLIFALFGAFVLGMLVWFFMSLGHDVKMRREASRLRKDNKKLLEELNALRSLSVEEITVTPPEE
ncbi:MAG: LapA family protein [Candidatus Eiseniibacteriota bacterium]|nr:MAG: LapA family protein [Candidatus Eisenbacteria bacterium]